MFKCQHCNGTKLKLMLQPSFKGKVDIETDAHQDVIIYANGKRFIADLMFVNQFAFCDQCSAVNSWQYFYPTE